MAVAAALDADHLELFIESMKVYLAVDLVLLYFTETSTKYKVTAVLHHLSLLVAAAVIPFYEYLRNGLPRRAQTKLRMYALQEFAAQLLTVQYYADRYGACQQLGWPICWLYCASRVVLPVAIRAVGRDQYGYATYTDDLMVCNIVEAIMFALNCAWAYGLVQRRISPLSPQRYRYYA